GTEFPVVQGRPVLIDDETSLFSRSEFLEGRHDAPGGERRNARIRSMLRRLLPSTDANLKAGQSYRLLSSLLTEINPRARVLMVAAGVGVAGASSPSAANTFELLRSGVSVGPSVDPACDAHAWPCADRSFDGVVIQAVLEHLFDPARCVAEIHR